MKEDVFLKEHRDRGQKRYISYKFKVPFLLKIFAC